MILELSSNTSRKFSSEVLLKTNIILYYLRLFGSCYIVRPAVNPIIGTVPKDLPCLEKVLMKWKSCVLIGYVENAKFVVHAVKAAILVYSLLVNVVKIPITLSA